MNRCSDYALKGCPASQYLICEAYKNEKNCWETQGVPCCKRDDKERCKECEVYKKAQELGFISNPHNRLVLC